MHYSEQDYKIQAQLAIDPKFRQTARENPALALKQLNYQLDGDVSVQFVENTKTKYHFVLWQQESQYQEMLELSASGTSGTVGTAGSAGTLGTATGTISTLLSVGSVGTAGSA